MNRYSSQVDYAEDAALLQFYDLDTLEPEIWVDHVAGPLNDAVPDSRLQQLFRQGYGNWDTNAKSNAPESDLRLSDDYDPLGIKSSIFENDTNNTTVNIMQLKEKSSLMITNKAFQPRHFLLQVHKDTSYNELVAGLERLRLSLDQRAEALKTLVHTNFDRFVSAKVTVDHVFQEMLSKQLNPQEEYSTRALRTALDEANARATQIYGPIVQRRNKVEKIRSTLSILQRYKFFFNLPSSLLESVKHNKYETAIRDYKRGKYLYNTLQTGDNALSEKDASGIPGLNDFDQDSDVTELHRKVFDKVWAEVNKIVIELRSMLFKILSDPWRSMEEQEKTINFLFDLDTTEDPAWFYLDSQYRWIMNLLKENFEKSNAKIQMLAKSNEAESSDVLRGLALRKAVAHVLDKNVDLGSERDHDVRIWRAILDLVKSLSALLLRCLPDFWRLSKAFIEGKFANRQAATSKSLEDNRRRRQGVDLAKVEQCQGMTRSIINLYADLVSNYFSLNEPQLQVQQNQDGKDTIIMPAFLPINADSIHVSEYLTRIIGDLAHCINDISGIHLAGEAFSGLTDLMEKARWKFVDIVCKCWERDAKIFYMLEDWILDTEMSQCTGLLKRFYSYHKFCARAAYRIASLSATAGEGSKHERPIVSAGYVDRIRASFLDSMYTFLDGLVRLALSDYTPLNEKEELQLAKKRGKIDVHSMDMRILLTVGNLAHMRATIIPKLVGLFETAYKCRMDEDRKTLVDVVDDLDEILFSDFIKRKSAIIRDIIRQGILMSGVDWFNIPKPTEVHAYVYEALMTLVMVHAQVSSVAKQLVYRALSTLLENMANDCLESFRHVERFGMGGMLQATLEIEFMHQTLQQYATANASETMQLIYQSIEQAYDANQQHSGNLQSELNHVKELLVYSRKSTVVQFLCFKQTKDRKKV